MEILETAGLAVGTVAFLILVSFLSGPGFRGNRRGPAFVIAGLLAFAVAVAAGDLIFRFAATGTRLLGDAGTYLPVVILTLVAAALVLVRNEAAERPSDSPQKLSVLSGAYIRTDRAGFIRLASGTLQPMFGVSAADMVGMRADTFYRSREDRESLLRRVAEAGGTLSLENVRMRRRDGSVIYVDFATALIADGSDCDGGLESFIQDVTRRRNIEETHETNEARFRDFAESASDWLWETDAQHRIVWLSDSFRRRSSVPESELLGAKFWDTIPTDSAQEISVADLRRWMEAELPIRNFRFMTTGADGRTRWRRSSARPYRDRNGQFAGYRGVTSDITSAMEAEHRFQTLTENSPDMVFVHRNDRIVYVNPAMIAAFGADNAESFIGRDTLELVHPDERERVSKRRSDQQRGDVGAGRHIVRMRRVDGSEFMGDVSIANIVWDGELSVLVTVRDVTERFAFERQVRESERQYRNLIELLPDAFCVQCDGVLVFTNAAARRILGGPDMPDLKGRKISEFVAPEFHERMRERRRIALSGQSLIAPERMAHLRSDGSRFEAEIVSAPIVWDGREGTLAIVTDISERAAAERARAFSEARFRDFAESTSDWFWETDSEHWIEWMSETFAARSGLDAANVIGKKLWETMGTEGSEMNSVSACRSQMELHRPFRNMRYTVRPKAGGVFWRSTSGQPRFGDDGAFLGYRGATSDITQERSTEQLIRESEERYRTLVELMPEGFLIQCEGRVVFANASARQMFGAGAENDLIGEDSLALVVPEFRAAAMESRSAIQSGRLRTLRLRRRHRRLDGTEFDCEVSSAAFEWNGRPATINILVDISERVEADQLIRESDARFRDFAESTSDWFWESDAEHRIVWLSDTYSERSGKKAEDILGRRLWEPFGDDPEEAAQVEHFRKLMTSRQPFRSERFRIAGPNGRIVWRATSGHPRFSDDGTFLGYRGATADITDEVGAEIRFKSLIENNPDIVFVQRDDRMVYVNPALPAAFGGAAADYIGKDPIMFFHPDMHASILERRKRLREGRPIERNLPRIVVRSDGTSFFGETTGARIDWDGGPALMVVLRDVDNRVQAENQVAASEERYRTLVELLPDGFTIQCEGVIVYANASARNILGAKSADELTGRDALSIVAPEWRDVMLRRRQEVEAGHAPDDRLRMRDVRLDGTEFDSEVSSAGFEWSGKPATINLLVDISERVVAEKIRRESELRFRDFAESTSDWFWETDSGLRFAWFSVPIHPLLGLDEKDIIGRHPWEIAGVDPAADRDWAEVETAMRARRPVRDANVDVHNRIGDRFRISISCKPNFDETGNFMGYRGSASDITRQVDTENRLRQAMKMEAIGQLTGGISHDFNNLLAIISGNLELIQERLGPDTEVNGFIEPALRAAGRGADLTQYLLAFSRQQPLNPRPTDINRLIAAMTDPLRRSLGERVDIEVVLAAGGWLAQVDPTQMENAILNLALNARDAMKEGGKLTVETANATLDREYADRFEDVRPGRYLMVSVSDEGTGIPPGLIDRVFDPFVTTKEVGQGSGLGLSMVYGFVKQTGGHIRLYSEVGKGTTVRMYLPKADTTLIEHAANAGREQIPTGSGETILVVEDDLDVLNLVTILLTNLDYRVLKASDAAAALNLVDSGARPDLLFTDVVLRGGAGGVELAKKIAERHPGIQVVYMSGYTENSIVHQGVLDEGVLLISKPFTKAELARMIRSAIDAKEPGNGNG